MKSFEPRLWLKAFILAVALAIPTSTSTAAPAIDTEHVEIVILTKTHQEIDNFGASDAWTMQKIGAWSDTSKNK